MAAGPDQHQAAIHALLDAVRPLGDGRSGIEAGTLTAFVTEQPELSAVACQALLRASATGAGKGYAQLAIALAAAYESVYEDDTLTVVSRQHFAALKQPFPTVIMDGIDLPEESVPARYDVPEDDLANCHIYPLVKFFSHRHLGEDESPDRLRGLRGRLFLTFPVPLSDPRHVWEVPSVRSYVLALADAMPYFPYFLATDPRLGMFEIYFGSLVDPDLLGGGSFDVLDERIVLVVSSALLETMNFAEAVGDDGEEVVRGVLSVFDDEAIDYVVELLADVRCEAEPE